MRELRFRQIHLDYHTSPLIEDVGQDFDAEEFAQTLKNASVNSVTCFAKCHHGMSYYPTKVGVMHPHLKIDLLGQMVETCHGIGIGTPAYISVGVDNYMGERHPEWLQCDQKGYLARPAPYEPGWYWLCHNSPYVDYVAAQTKEVLSNYDVDGVFFDIVIQKSPGCLCPSCRSSMTNLGMDIGSDADLRKHTTRVMANFLKRMEKIVHDVKPEASLFFNPRVSVCFRAEQKYYTHVEIESLPTAFWGYHHFPYYLRFCRTLGMEILGMTARFHKNWADFGGIKTRAQLEYECATMLAGGAKCSIGDQLHPRGKLDEAVYALIGSVYGDVASKEPWCVDAKPKVQVAILVLESPEGSLEMSEASEGAMKMLLELKHQFNIIDPEEDFQKYEVLILPDTGRISEETVTKLQGFLDARGKLLLSYEATLNHETKEFSCPGIGVKYVQPSTYSPDFIHLGETLSHTLPNLDFVMYERGAYVKPMDGTETLAEVYNPYFNRTFKAFTSHFQSPVDRKSPYPAVTRRENIVYVYSPIFQAYYQHGYYVYKSIVENCLKLLLPRRFVNSNAPPSSEVSLMEQPGRLIAHIVNYQPQRRGKHVEYIEEAYPTRDVKLQILTETCPTRVYLAPSRENLEFLFNKPYTSCIIPEVKVHQMVIFEL